jgi:hypothetical protein
MRVTFSAGDYTPADRVDALRAAVSTTLAAVDINAVGGMSTRLSCRDVGLIRASAGNGATGGMVEMRRTRRPLVERFSGPFSARSLNALLRDAAPSPVTETGARSAFAPHGGAAAKPPQAAEPFSPDPTNRRICVRG